MNAGRVVIIAFTGIACLLGCAAKPPFQNVPPTILFVPDNLSPKWHVMTKSIVPKRINRMANSSVVASESKSATDYKLVLRFVRADKEITGSSFGGIGSVSPIGVGAIGGQSKNRHQFTIEAEAELIDRQGKSVWKWVGYGEDKDADEAIEEIADDIASDLAKNGFLPPK